jgi:hypothetical protein
MQITPAQALDVKTVVTAEEGLVNSVVGEQA